MTTIFYLSVMFFIFMEAYILKNTTKVYEYLSKESDTLPEKEKKDWILKAGIFSFIQLYYWLIACIGVIKSPYRLWFAMILACAIIKSLLPNNNIIRKIDCAVSILILSYIIYLKYLAS